MYATVDFICIDWFEVSATWRERELQNEKFLPTAGFEPTTSGLLEWRSNRLSHGDLWLWKFKGNLYPYLYRYTLDVLLGGQIR